MFRILVDTCVWLDLAKDYRQGPLLEAVELLLDKGAIQLILPRTITDEFGANKRRIVDEGRRSLSSALKRAKDAIGRLGEGKGKRAALAQLDDVDHRLPQLGESVIDAIDRIDRLFACSEVIEINEGVLLEAARRAVDKRAPFHRQRNGISDAILFEVYKGVASQRVAGTRYAFITHNTKDFSEPGGPTSVPHADIASAFSRIRSLYMTSLSELLKRVNPHLVTDLMIDQEWPPEPRRLTEMLAAVAELTDKVWYGRHGLLRESVESGRTKVVPRGQATDDPNTVPRDIWLGARKAAAQVEKRYGLENLGPWDDFEWGMLSGKLSALRWVLGDQWDMLDT